MVHATEHEPATQNDETGKTIDAPPPEILETDPGLSPEEAEQIRRDYLLKRFWISAKGFWGAAGGRLAWITWVPTASALPALS